MSKKIKKDSDAQGVTRLVTDATIGITDIVEAMHKRIVHPPFLPSTPIQNLITEIASLTYKNIRWTAGAIGDSVDKLLGKLAPMMRKLESSDQQAVVRSALNGVIGDYLEKTNNPLAIKMELRYESKSLQFSSQELNLACPNSTGNILLMVHGSSMNDIQWTQKHHNHGTALARELDKTPLYLHYNSGRHISSNGKELDQLLENLVANWPVPVNELVVVAHSMGGLVTRSAVYYGQQEKKFWTEHLKKIIFLGTPHHGAPLEKAGNYLDTILETIPYTKPLAKLGKIRSAGVTDLRYGNILDEDWKDSDRFKNQGDKRHLTPLPEMIDTYSVAASKGNATETLKSRTLGDGLVTVPSALGKHKDPSKSLDFKEENTSIVHECTHLDLLSSLEVYDQIKEWVAN